MGRSSAHSGGPNSQPTPQYQRRLGRQFQRRLLVRHLCRRLNWPAVRGLAAPDDAQIRKPLHLILDGLPAHKTLAVKKYVAGLGGKLTLLYLPGYAYPDELVWSHAKRTGSARQPLQKGKRLADRINAQLTEMARRPALVRSLFRHPSVAYVIVC